MARSARHLVKAAPAIGLFALTGCATTQQEAARLQLNSARERAAQLKVEVTRSGPDVTVQSVEVVTARGGSAFIVRLKNAVAL